MAKIVVDDAKFSRITVSGVENGKNAVPSALDMKGGDFSPAPRLSGRSGKHIKDEIKDDEVVDVVVDVQAVSDNAITAPEQSMLLAQTDIPLTPDSASVTAEPKAVDFFSTPLGMWGAGLGIAAVGTGTVIALSGNNNNNNNNGSTNSAPVITSGNTGSVNENAVASTVIYDAVATDADAGATITYSLKAATGDVAQLDINPSTGEVTLKSSADFETKSSYSFTVIADDGTKSSEQPVTVSVTDLNDNTPIISSGATGSVAENAATSTVIYDAAATDADAGTTITYSLKAATGDIALLDINASTGEVTLKASADFETKPSYSFTVVASDGTNNSEQPVTVSVTDLNDNTPIISSGATGNVAENAAISTVIYGVAATDADAGTTITYSLKPLTGDVALLDINASTGEVTLKASADFETKPSYSFTVVASDGTNSSEQAVTLAINDLNEAPVINSPNSGNAVSMSVDEGIATVADVDATDVDAGQAITYSLSGIDSGQFTINSGTGVVAFASAPDYETALDDGGDNTYNFTVVATDNGTGSLTDTQDFVVTVNDLTTDPPIFSSGATGNVDENDLISTVIYNAVTDIPEGPGLTYSLSGPDAELVSIDPSTGEVTLKSSADYETKASYSFTVIATSSGAISEQPVIITVNDINEAPTSTVVTLTAILEDSTARLITQDELLANAVDVDGDSLTATDLTITAGNGTLVDNFNGTWSYTPAGDDDTAVSFSYTVSDGALTAAGLADLDITPVNDAPVITSNGGGATASISVAENRTAVTTVTVTDGDVGDTQTYSIAGDDDELFEIDSNGVLTFRVAPDFENPGDSDGNNIYNVQVTVEDSDGLTDVQDIAVAVTNYKNVVVESSGAYIDLNANGLKDAEETILADFTPDTGNVDLGLNPVIIHFNDAPNNPLNLSGFGNNDLIEIDAQAFIDNGHNALNILALATTPPMDEFGGSLPFTTASTIFNLNLTSAVYNRRSHISNNFTGSGTFYSKSNAYPGTSTTLTATIGLSIQVPTINAATRYLRFFSSSTSANTNVQLASGLPTDMSLQDVVDFVNLPVQPATVHVVVDSDGAVIDIDGDGVRDIGENRLANFGTDGNADLAVKSVVIQFNDKPNIPLNLTGFGEDDLVEIDAQAFFSNGHLGLAPLGDPGAMTLDQFVTSGATTASGLYQYFTTFGAGAGESYLLSRTATSIWFGVWLSNTHSLGFWSYTNAGGSQLAVFSNLNFTSPHPLQAMVDFVNLPQDIQIVVDQRGAFFDANANGIVDGTEWSNPADFDPAFGNVFVGYNHVTVHYNDMPNDDINLSGFGADDLIEIDVQAFLDNGHNALQILNQPNISTIDALHNALLPTGTGPISSTNKFNSLTSHYYVNSIQQKILNSWGSTYSAWVAAGLSVSSWSSSLNFFSNNGTSSNSGRLATQVPTDMPLWQTVDYVNVPLPPDPLDPVYVVVEQTGAVIDFDGDGVRDNGENWLADFGVDGNADLTGNSVVIHFNDIPMSALNLTGFGTDDKLEIDTGDGTWLANFGVGASSVNYQLAHYSGPATIATTTIRVNQISNLITVTGSTSGTIAYWTDASNALNNPANLLTDFNGTNNTTVLANLNANHYPGLIEFVWPVNVVVESEGAFIDANANGVYENGEVAVDSFQSGGNADLAANNVLIHFNDLPGTPLDFTGFDGNDRIEIDLVAMKLGNDSILRNSQGSRTFRNSTQFYEGASGVRFTSGFGTSVAAVFVEGSILKTGHLTWTSSRTVGGSTTSYQKFTATSPFEGTLAINVGPLYNHFQQVAYVVGGGPT